MSMSNFQVPPAIFRPKQSAPAAPTALPFRAWNRRIGVLSLGLLLACQGGSTSPANGEAAAPANAAPPSSSPANAAAPGAAFTLLIDGESQQVQSATLVMLKAKGGFTISFEAGKVAVEITGGPKAPLVVGKYAIRDTASAVLLTGNLPAKLRKERAEPDFLDSFSAPYIVSVSENTPLGYTFIYDWGKGLQGLRGRLLGQLVFTRVGNGTADGLFQSLVYRPGKHSIIEYQGRPRALIRLEEHTVKGTFRNLPFGNYEQSMEDLQKALKAAEGLR